jgi:ATP-dependent phosphoenolpyruvate carboxykinase
VVGRGARVPQVEWTEEPAFGYEVTASVPGVDDIEIPQPRGLYERTGRAADYAGTAGMKRERSEYLASFDGAGPLDPQVDRPSTANVPPTETAGGTCAPNPSLSPAVCG